ncbi:hypothetical protein C8Q79DRAFT_961367 [Trametes meyenii]|nr:hypothetical protein C8Q79DRAFT_961367 [Trametes meyenii]
MVDRAGPAIAGSVVGLKSFYEETGPDHSCQRQPDPDGGAATAIFKHDSRLSLSTNFKSGLALQLVPHPRLSLPPPPAYINLVYFLHPTPHAHPAFLKMPVSSESPLHGPYHLRPQLPHPSPSIHLRPERPRVLEISSLRGRLQLLSLNPDVLRIIGDFCAPLDALQFAMTCRTAYDLSMPRVLSDVSIGDPGEDDGPTRLEKFCRFMLAKPRRRIRHMRALRLLEGAFARVENVRGRDRLEADFSSADVLAKLLHQADNLRVIHIRDAEPLFQFNPAVYEALAHLTALKEVSLYYIGNSTLKAISQMRSRPAIIENGLWKDGPRPQGDVTPFGPFVESMKHLKLWECGCMLESIIDRHVWPHLHTLEIGGRIAKISELAHAFPSLRRLTFHLEFSVKPETGPAACWSELDYFETSAPIPSFPSPARRLKLQYPIGMTSGSHNASDLKTLQLIERTNPVVLSCTVSDAIPATMLERMKGSMPSLRYLELVQSSRLAVPWHAFQRWTEHHIDILRTSSIVGLCIAYVGADVLHEEPAELEARRRRHASLARTLATEIGSLEYIGVGVQDATGGMYALDCSWYRVSSRPADGKGAPALEALGSFDGERIRQTLQDTPREA